MAKAAKKTAKKKGKYDITVKTDLSFEQLMNLAVNKLPTKKEKIQMTVLLDFEMFEDEIMNTHLLAICIESKKWLNSKIEEYKTIKNSDGFLIISIKPGNIGIGCIASSEGEKNLAKKWNEEFIKEKGELDNILLRLTSTNLN